MGGCAAANGPDLGLFCFLARLMHALTDPSQAPPSTVPPGAWIVFVVAALAAGFLFWRLVSLSLRAERRRRHAARAPASYVQCPECRALSPDGQERCYSCGSSLAGATIRVPTAPAEAKADAGPTHR